MLKNLTFYRASAVAIALAITMLTTVSSQAQKVPAAEVGLAFIVGSQTSGSTIKYEFWLNTTTSGTLLVKATIKGKKLKGNFPDYTATPMLGVSKVTGTSFTLPSTFTGKATVTLKVLFNGKRVGAKVLLLNITPPPPPALVSVVSTNLYDVGFENVVMLDGTVVTTAGMSNPVVYAWVQTSGKPVTLSATNVPAPTFTTDTITNFVNMGTGLYVNDVDDFGFTNQIYATPEHRFGTIGGIAMDAEQTGTLGAQYGFRLVVSQGSVTRTGLFTVACSLQTPAHPNIPVGVTAYYRSATNSSNWTLVTKPAGSAAALTHTNGLIAQLRPDVAGIYIVQDVTTGKSVTNTAATWTGVQFCNICHGPSNSFNNPDIVTPWQNTRHATFFQRAIDGQTSAGSHYNESCIACHTVGVNKSPAANNGGFDDVAATLGWKFPSTLQPGNYAAMPDQLKNLANIQCESCHGPGGRHPGSPSVSLDVKVCAQCHQDGNHHVRPQQWEISPHAGAYEAIGARGFGTRSDCARCHSPVGFTAIMKGEADVVNTNSIPFGTGPLTCQSCHDPHDTHGDDPDRHQLRAFDSVLLGNPYFRSNTVTIALGESLTTADLRLTNSNLVVTNTGASAACIVCHNGRQLPTQVQLYGSNKGKMFFMTGGPHDQTAGEAFLGVGAYDYGQVMGNSFHTHLADCQACHMHQLQAGDSILTNDIPVTLTAGTLANYANVVGDHTFKMDYVSVVNGATNVVDNIAACNKCHDSFPEEHVDSFDFKSVFGQDYDGNGATEGVQTETQGVLDNLGLLLQTTGLTATTNTVGHVTNISGTYSTNAVLLAAQREAAWNWFVCYREGSFGVHNTQYTIRLLQTSYTDLSTNYYGDVSKTYQNAFPNAYLR